MKNAKHPSASRPLHSFPTYSRLLLMLLALVLSACAGNRESMDIAQMTPASRQSTPDDASAPPADREATKTPTSAFAERDETEAALEATDSPTSTPMDTEAMPTSPPIVTEATSAPNSSTLTPATGRPQTQPTSLPTTRAPATNPNPAPPMPTPTLPADLHSGTALTNNQSWKNGPWSLTVSQFTYDSFANVRFSLRNNSGRTIIVPEFSASQFQIVADSGEIFAPCSIKGDGWFNTWWQDYGGTELEDGETFEWEWTFHPYDPEHRACNAYSNSQPPLPADAHTLTLVVTSIGDMITDARWQLEIPRP